MTKRISAKHKIDRRLGENIWGRPKSPVNKREYGPGQHGQRRRGKVSDFGIQLRAKQKLKGYYANINERQFKNIYKEATRLKGDTSENLIGLLERRLDAVVYRAKFVPTPFAARQFVNHGHILVNGRRVNISSYRCRAGDVVEIQERSRGLVTVLEAVQSPSATCPTISRPTIPRCGPASCACRSSATCLIRCAWNRIWSSSSIRARSRSVLRLGPTAQSRAPLMLSWSA